METLCLTWIALLNAISVLISCTEESFVFHNRFIAILTVRDYDICDKMLIVCSLVQIKIKMLTQRLPRRGYAVLFFSHVQLSTIGVLFPDPLIKSKSVVTKILGWVDPHHTHGFTFSTVSDTLWSFHVWNGEATTNRELIERQHLHRMWEELFVWYSVCFQLPCMYGFVYFPTLCALLIYY